MTGPLPLAGVHLLALGIGLGAADRRARDLGRVNGPTDLAPMFLPATIARGMKM